jgi:hypothetical protein
MRYEGEGHFFLTKGRPYDLRNTAENAVCADQEWGLIRYGPCRNFNNVFPLSYINDLFTGKETGAAFYCFVDKQGIKISAAYQNCEADIVPDLHGVTAVVYSNSEAFPLNNVFREWKVQMREAP